MSSTARYRERRGEPYQVAHTGHPLAAIWAGIQIAQGLGVMPSIGSVVNGVAGAVTSSVTTSVANNVMGQVSDKAFAGSSSLNPFRYLNTEAIAAETSKEVMSWSMTSFLALGAMGLGTKALLGVYGDSVTRMVYGSIQDELSRFRNRFSKSPQTGAPPARWYEWGASTNPKSMDSARAVVSSLPIDSIGVYLLLFGSFLSFLHYSGASDIKEQLARHKAKVYAEETSLTASRQSPAIARAREAESPFSHKTQMDRLEGQQEWDQLVIRDAIAHTAQEGNAFTLFGWGGGKQQSAKAMDEQRAHAAALKHLQAEAEQQDAFLDRHLRELYLGSPYYTPGKNGSYYAVGDISVIRALINTMLGFMLQMEAVLNGGRRSKNDAAGAAGHLPPFYVVARVISGCAYWELFAHAIRLHGWGPVYVAVQYIIGLLSAVLPGAR
jgi:hypothetical protein